MLVAAVILSVIVTWFYKSKLSPRDRLVRVFIVAFFTFCFLPAIEEWTDNLTFDPLKEAAEMAIWPVMVLALCGSVVSFLGLLWFELVMGETSYGSGSGSSGGSWGGGFDGDRDGGSGDWGGGDWGGGD